MDSTNTAGLPLAPLNANGEAMLATARRATLEADTLTHLHTAYRYAIDHQQLVVKMDISDALALLRAVGVETE